MAFCVEGELVIHCPQDHEQGNSGSLALSVIVVNYNSWDDVGALARSLSESRGLLSGRAELVIVDNASSEGVPPEELRLGRVPGLKLVVSPENGGFSAGVNLGWRASAGRWLLLLNPDVVAGPELVNQVLARIGELEAAGPESEPPGIVGFALQNSDGTPQASVGAEVGLGRTLIEAWLPRAGRKYQPVGRRHGGPVPWVTGACLLADRSIFDALGGMDEDFFLYYEEVALCRSARDLGRRVEFDPSVSVVHLRPLQNRVVSPSIRVITRHSRLVFFKKHQPAWQFRCMVWLSRLEALIRGSWCRLLGLHEESCGWRRIREISKDMGRGLWIPGRLARDLAYRLALVDSAPGAGQVVRRPPHFMKSWVRSPTDANQKRT